MPRRRSIQHLEFSRNYGQIFNHNFKVDILFKDSICRAVDLTRFRGSLDSEVDELDAVARDS